MLVWSERLCNGMSASSHMLHWGQKACIKLLQLVCWLKDVFGADAAETQPSRKKSKKQKKKQKQQQAQMAAAGQDSEEEQAAAQAIHTHHNSRDDEVEDGTAHSSQDGEEDVLERMMEAANISQSAVSGGAHQVDNTLLVDNKLAHSLHGCHAVILLLSCKPTMMLQG